jgi:hypothetical protein
MILELAKQWQDRMLSPAGSGQLGDKHILTLFTIMTTRQDL